VAFSTLEPPGHHQQHLSRNGAFFFGAGVGGEIFYSGTLTVTNSTFSGNTAETEVGAFSMSSTRVLSP
jgi:hypothetical protein